MNPGNDDGGSSEAGAATGAHGKQLCALLLRRCASPYLVLDFLFSFAFPLFLSWHFHAVAAFCMRRVPTAAAVVVAFLVAAVLHFVGCGTSGGSDKSQPSLCLYPNALILKAFKIVVRFLRHCSCLGRCPEHLFLYPTKNSAG